MRAAVAIWTLTERTERYDATRYAIAIGCRALLSSIRQGVPRDIDSLREPSRSSTIARLQTCAMSRSRANEKGTDTPTINMKHGQMRS